MASKIGDLQSEALGIVSSIRTLLEGYPKMVEGHFNIFASLGGSKNTMDYLYNFLTTIGVTNEEIIEKVSTFLTGNGEQGFLDTIEPWIKAALLTNIKSVMGCSIEPIIPDELFDKYKTTLSEKDAIGEGISVPISAIDFMGTLNMCPTSEIGKNYYYDAYGTYYPSNLWQTRDMNAFLWYTINKGVIGDKKLIWDNRNSILTDDWLYKKSDFLTSTGGTIEGLGISKNKIAQFSYSENYGELNDKLTVRICADNYYRKKMWPDLSKDAPLIHKNKTIFEFNYDFIYSFKLFDSKVLVASIIDNLIHGSYGVNINLSSNGLVVNGQIQKIIKKIIESEDDESVINDCYFDFSNEEYDALLLETEKKRLEFNDFSYGNKLQLSSSKILDNLSGITSESSLQEIKDSIKTTIFSFTEEAANDANGNSYNSDVKNNTKRDVINRILNEITTNIVISVLSPKVMLLMEFNKYVFGVNNKDNTKVTNPGEYFQKEIMGTMQGLIVSIIKKVVNLVMTYFYNFAIDAFKKMAEAFMIDLLLEKIQLYKRLLERLYSDYKIWLSSMTKKTTSTNNIDDVTYADIAQSTPITTTC